MRLRHTPCCGNAHAVYMISCLSLTSTCVCGNVPWPGRVRLGRLAITLQDSDADLSAHPALAMKHCVSMKLSCWWGQELQIRVPAVSHGIPTAGVHTRPPAARVFCSFWTPKCSPWPVLWILKSPQHAASCAAAGLGHQGRGVEYVPELSDFEWPCKHLRPMVLHCPAGSQRPNTGYKDSTNSLRKIMEVLGRQGAPGWRLAGGLRTQGTLAPQARRHPQGPASTQASMHTSRTVNLPRNNADNPRNARYGHR